VAVVVVPEEDDDDDDDDDDDVLDALDALEVEVTVEVIVN
jgi:hypothetical protein